MKTEVHGVDKEIKEMIAIATNKQPQLLFSIYYNDQNHMMNVHLKRIERLPTCLPVKSADSFVQVYLLPDPTKMRPKQVFTTPIVKQSREPLFDSMATFRGMRVKDLSKEELVFRVYVNNNTRFIGGVYYPLPPLDYFGDNVIAEIRQFPEEECLKVFNELSSIIIATKIPEMIGDYVVSWLLSIH